MSAPPAPNHKRGNEKKGEEGQPGKRRAVEAAKGGMAAIIDAKQSGLEAMQRDLNRLMAQFLTMSVTTLFEYDLSIPYHNHSEVQMLRATNRGMRDQLQPVTDGSLKSRDDRKSNLLGIYVNALRALHGSVMIHRGQWIGDMDGLIRFGDIALETPLEMPIVYNPDAGRDAFEAVFGDLTERTSAFHRYLDVLVQGEWEFYEGTVEKIKECNGDLVRILQFDAGMTDEEDAGITVAAISAFGGVVVWTACLFALAMRIGMGFFSPSNAVWFAQYLDEDRVTNNRIRELARSLSKRSLTHEGRRNLDESIRLLRLAAAELEDGLRDAAAAPAAAAVAEEVEMNW